ncbi:MAG: tyrosine-type recombinase/integrase [Actinomycetota bacterium]|nr:tyrosine-type recombinase/integrase [Actinomycetota bacterium]
MKKNDRSYEENFQDFLDYLRFERMLSPNTQVSYRRDLEKYGNFLKQKKINHLHIEDDDILKFLKQLRQEQGSNSISRILSSLRGFYKFLVRQQQLQKNPFAEISNPKLPRRLVDVLTEQEISIFLDTVRKKANRSKQRDIAMFELLYSCGLRASELVNLKLKNIDIDEGLLFFIGKGKKERITPIGQKALDALTSYKDQERRTAAKYGQDYVFLNRFGKQLSRQALWKIMKKYGRLTGLKDSLPPYTAA